MQFILLNANYLCCIASVCIGLYHTLRLNRQTTTKTRHRTISVVINECCYLFFSAKFQLAEVPASTASTANLPLLSVLHFLFPFCSLPSAGGLLGNHNLVLIPVLELLELRFGRCFVPEVEHFIRLGLRLHLCEGSCFCTCPALLLLLGPLQNQVVARSFLGRRRAPVFFWIQSQSHHALLWLNVSLTVLRVVSQSQS